MDSASAPEATASRRVLVLGLDAADTGLLLEGIENGSLPNLERMRDRGAWGVVTSPPGFGSGAVWPSWATGVSPARHSRYYYVQVRPGSYEGRRFEAEEFRANPIWDQLSAAGKNVAIFDVPKIGLSENLNGLHAVDWISHGRVYDGLRTSPESYATDLVGRFGENPMPKCDVPGGRDETQMRSFMNIMSERVQQRERCTLETWGDDTDLLITVFAEPHCVGHQTWHIRDSEHPQYDTDASAALGDPLFDIYADIDRSIGRIVDEVDDNTVVMVFSGTGMGPNYTGNNVLDDVLLKLEGARATTRRAWTRRLKLLGKRYLPTSLRQRGRPFKRRVEESAAVGDRARRRAFQVPHNDISGAIRLNIVGREPAGLLQTDEVDAYIDSLRADLLDLRNADTGEPVVERVVRISDEVEGEWLDHLPDLFVIWNRASAIDRVTSPKIGVVEHVHRGNRTGDHNPESCFFAVGAGIEPGEVQGVSIHDFAPTLAHLVGVDAPGTDGSVIGPLSSLGGSVLT